MKKLLLILIFFITINSIAQNKPSRDLIGTPFKIGYLEIAQYDFPEKMRWFDASNACINLGEGWRLPDQNELDLIYKNASKIENLRTGILRNVNWSMPYPIAFERIPTKKQVARIHGALKAGPLVGAPNGAIKIAPINKPTPKPETPRSKRATFAPMTMYAAHIIDARKIKNKPTGSLPNSIPESIKTPITAQTNASAFRLVRVRSAATVIGPINSIATPLPRSRC